MLYTQVISPLYSGGGQVFVPSSNIKFSRELLAQYDTAIKQADVIVNQSKTLKTDYDAFDENTIKTLNVMIPSSVNEVMITDEFTEFVKRSNLKIDEFSIGPSTVSDIPGLGTYTAVITVVGGYEDFKATLRFIEGSLRFYDIQSVDFSINEKEPELSIMKVSFKTYYLKS